MSAGRWNDPKADSSKKEMKLTIPARSRDQKVTEETRQKLTRDEIELTEELIHPNGGRNVSSQATGPYSAGELQSSVEAEKVEKKQLTVLIADDHPVVREGLTAIIQLQQDLLVVAEASNGREAVEKFFSYRPDIALLDLRMPLMSGVEAVEAIYQREPRARLAILTSYESEEEIYRALRAGAQGYVLKDAPAADLISCIRAMSEGRTWIPPGIGATLAKRVKGQELTSREMEVLRTLVQGKSNKEIGALLDIAESTVKVHVTHVLEKLKAGGRTEAISVALKRGLIRMDSAQG